MKIRQFVIALLAFFGMIDALYLSIKRNSGPVPCHITHGCTQVLTSKYSELAGIPVSWFGLAFYVTVFSLAVFSSFDAQEKVPGAGLPMRLIFYLSGLALIISALLVGVQAFILKQFCEYCLLSASLVLTIFLVTPHPTPRKLPE
jgi:uncharacterized membrane protein